MKIRACAAVLLLVAALSACTSSTNAVIQSLQYAVQKESAATRAPLNPDLRYLRATVDGRVVLLVLGYVENHPQGPVQVWYSAEREVLRLQNGRVVGAVGLTTEWRNVSQSELPSWAALKRSEGVSRWVRIRDVMPGYRFGVRDVLVLRAANPPARSALQDVDPQSVAWFEEGIETDGDETALAKENRLPLARYAVASGDVGETVVYGEQCLAPKLCFSWQTWPAVPQTAKDAR